MPFTLRDLVQPYSRTDFSARSSLRVVDWSSNERFIRFDEITVNQIKECPALGEIRALDATHYLAEYAGFPGLVKGCAYGGGMTAFSSNLKNLTLVPHTRISGGKITFGQGTTKYQEDRCDCFEFVVKRERVEVITPFIEGERLEQPFVISRPDNTTCPICMDDLSGNVVKCLAEHQVCLPCFNLLHTSPPGVKKCPLCNTANYSIFEYRLVEQMNGAPVDLPPYFSIGLDGGNSFKQFIYNEALFMGAIKYSGKSHGFDNFQSMLLSSFYHFYMTHKEHFGSYEFNALNQSNGNTRTFSPHNDDLTASMNEYLEIVNTPAIYNDVAYTRFYLNYYREDEFLKDLETIEGDNSWNRLKKYTGIEEKPVLQREIYFRTQVSKRTAEEMRIYFKDIFIKIILEHSRFGAMFKRTRVIQNNVP